MQSSSKLIALCRCTLGLLLMYSSLFAISESAPFGPIFMPNDRDTFEMIDNCNKARDKFTKDFEDCKIQLLGVTDLAYLDKKCQFSFNCECANISRTIDISARNILDLPKVAIRKMIN